MSKNRTPHKQQTLKCPTCETGSLLPFTGDFATESEGRDFTVPDVEMERCDNCGETVLTPTGSKHVSAYLARATNSLPPEELRFFLTKYHLTQKEAATILGTGEKNFSRWLSGRQRVSASMSNYIRTLLAHPEAFETLKNRHWQKESPSTDLPKEERQPDAAEKKILTNID